MKCLLNNGAKLIENTETYPSKPLVELVTLGVYKVIITCDVARQTE